MLCQCCEGRVWLVVAETVETFLQIRLGHFLVHVEDVDRCFEWGSAEDWATGCCCGYEIEYEQAFTGFAGGVECYCAVGGNDRLDEPLRVVEFDGDNFVEV